MTVETQIKNLNKLSKMYLSVINDKDIINIEAVSEYFNILSDLKKSITQPATLPKARFIKAGNSDWNRPFNVVKISNLPMCIGNMALSSDATQPTTEESAVIHTESIEEFLRRGGKKQVFQYISEAETQTIPFVTQESYSLDEGALYFSEKSKHRMAHKFNLELIDKDLIESLKQDGIILIAAKKRGRQQHV